MSKILFKSLPIGFILGLLNLAFIIYNYKIFPENIGIFAFVLFYFFQILIFVLISRNYGSEFGFLYKIAFFSLFLMSIFDFSEKFVLHQFIDTSYKERIAEKKVLEIQERAEKRSREKNALFIVTQEELENDRKFIIENYQTKGLFKQLIFDMISNLIIGLIFAGFAWATNKLIQ